MYPDELQSFEYALMSVGWIRNGFMLSFYFLKLYKIYQASDKQFFRYALMKTMSVGGDTDTNCCIVMGMVGALIGFKNIPLIDHIIRNRPQSEDVLDI